MKTKKNYKKIFRIFGKQFVCVVLSFFVILPFYMVLVNSFKTKTEAARMSLSLPTEWVFSNYTDVIAQGNLMTGFFNSLTYAVVSTTLGVLLCAMAAYVMCRRATKTSHFIYYFMICGLFFPINYVTLVKVFQFFGLLNSRTGVIITFISAMIPFCVFTIRNFVLSVPLSMDEAAVIDGAGANRLFFFIIFPLLKPILVTCFILQFMGVWSDFLTPLYLSSQSKFFPMTMSVYQFFGKNTSYWNYIFANIVLSCIPVIVVYLLGQRYIMSGLTTGAVKE